MIGLEFSKLREVLKTKQKLLKAQGRGNLPNRDQALTDDDVDKLWQSSEMGTNTPESLLNALWWTNAVNFGLRSVTPHRNMRWGDVTIKVDSNGQQYLEYNERQTKTRTGENTRNVRLLPPKAWATNDERCPVKLFNLYSQLRPSNFSTPDSPFYLATNSKTTPPGNHPWFKRQPVGVNKLSSIMKRMARCVGLQHGHFTNHSARKYLVQKLSDNHVSPNEIIQISGHRNLPSINSYSQISETYHREISTLITCTERPQSTAMSLTPTVPSRRNGPRAQEQQSSALEARKEFLNSIFSAPIYGGTINIIFYNSDNGPVKN